MSSTGVADVLSRFKAAPEKAKSHLKTAVFVSTAATSNRVESLAPRDTGRLQNEITFDNKDLTGRVLIGADAFYWRMVEYGYFTRFSSLGGRRFIGARPFVRSATEIETKPFIERVEEAAKRFAAEF